MKELPQVVSFPELTHPEEVLRHVIGILVPIDLEKTHREALGRRADAELATGIIVSISEQWFLISAGHLVDDLREKFQKGNRLLPCRLIAMGNLERDTPPIQFGLFDPESPTFLNPNLMTLAINKDGVDCLIVAVNKSLRDLLEHRGVQALDESTWRQPPEHRDIHYLVGFPASLAELCAEIDETQVSVDLKMIAPVIPILPTSNPPQKLLKQFDRLFFHIPRVNGHSDGKPKQFDHPGGMSGGPIIAGRITGDNEIEACVIGIQSSWDKETRVIAATPWTLVVRVIDEFLKQWKNAVDSIPTLSSLPTTTSAHPLTRFAGCMKDDPLYDECQAAVAEYRDQCDQSGE